MHAEWTIGIVGLGVMGRNLALNFRDRGVRIVAFDPDTNARARAQAEESRSLRA